MAPRDTRTGAVLESMVLPALTMSGYTFRKQVNIGLRPSDKRYVIDVLAKDGQDQTYLISLKWQQVSGTAWLKWSYNPPPK